MKQRNFQFRLRFDRNKIPYWASRYSYKGEAEIIAKAASPARDRGYMTKLEFVAIANWKTPRSRSRIASNDPGLVEDVTRLALSRVREEMKIGTLLILTGVSWPTASVILHLCDRDRYPILDFRALWSLGSPQPAQYSFDFWWRYTVYMRELQESTGHDMRTLDRALWQYSKEKQRPTRHGRLTGV